MVKGLKIIDNKKYEIKKEKNNMILIVKKEKIDSNDFKTKDLENKNES